MGTALILGLLNLICVTLVCGWFSRSCAEYLDRHEWLRGVGPFALAAIGILCIGCSTSIANALGSGVFGLVTGFHLAPWCTMHFMIPLAGTFLCGVCFLVVSWVVKGDF